jgi:MFS family permease
MNELAAPISASRRMVVLLVAFLGWMFAGQTMSLHLLFTRPVTMHFIDEGAIAAPTESFKSEEAANKWRETQAAKWLGWHITAFLAGAAAGGALFGWLGDRIGRTRAMGLAILCYSLATGISYFARSPEELLVERFIACLGVGGIWPNGVALVSEVWSDVSRPFLAGVIGAAANVGIVAFGLIAVEWKITPESWRWIFLVGSAPVVLGIIALAFVPESPGWLAQRDKPRAKGARTAELFGPELRYATIIGILLGTIPVVGNWGGNNWIIQWSDQVAGRAAPEAKAWMQIYRSSGGIVGSLFGGYLANLFGRRTMYFAISAACLFVCTIIYSFLTPADKFWFPIWVFVLGIVGVVYFGWLPLYLPELFPTRVRSTGTGLSFNFGRLLAIPCVLGAAYIYGLFGSYAKVGQITSLVYIFGMIVACLAPDTSKRDLKE